MRCPSCKETNKDRVIDSRLTDGGRVIRRRRVCTACQRRYTTKERIEEEPRLMVIKKNGSRMPFDIERVTKGMSNACYKRPISSEDLQRVAEELQEELLKDFEREVPSTVIGALVAKRLRELDQVAYVRFASVYREMGDLDDLLDEIQFIKGSSADRSPGQGSLFD